MTITAVKEHKLAATWWRRYGGIEAAAIRAGIRGWPVRVAFPRIPRKRLRSLLRARVAKHKPLSRVAITTEQPRVAYGITRIRPDWREALSRLGFDSA